jgi:membrane-associated phospholipid phosphatase
MVGTTAVARADPAGPPAPQPPLVWDPAWTHAGTWDYALAGTATAAVAVEIGVFQDIRPPLRWTDPILFDTNVRDALRSPSDGTRKAYNYAASVLWGVQLSYPVVVDVPYAWAHYGRQVAWDLFWQDAVTEIVAGAVDAALRDLAGRARPYVYDCLRQGGANCLESPESTRSFPGGHFANSTADALLLCTQHLYMHLYGGPWDGLACALTLASNFTIGVMRIVSDDHWVSDEIFGGTLGALIGWGVPYAMHLHGHASMGSALVVPMPLQFDHGGGLGVVGLF